MNETKEIKEKIFNLVDKSEDKSLLQIINQILNQDLVQRTEKIALTSDQEKELLDAYDESMDENNLIDHQTLLHKNSGWLAR